MGNYNSNNPELRIEHFAPIVGQICYERENGKKFNQTAVNADRLILTACNLSFAAVSLVAGLEALF